MKLELTEQEAENLMGVIDAGVKALGVRAVMPLVPILNKINAAIAPQSNGAGHVSDAEFPDATTGAQ